MFFAQFFMNDPLALKIETPLGSWPAPRASKLLLVMEVETKRRRFIYATWMRQGQTNVLVQRSNRILCRGEEQHRVEHSNPWGRGVGSSGITCAHKVS